MQSEHGHDVFAAGTAQAQPILFDSVDVCRPLVEQRDVDSAPREHATDDGADCTSPHDSNACRHIASVAAPNSIRSVAARAQDLQDTRVKLGDLVQEQYVASGSSAIFMPQTTELRSALKVWARTASSFTSVPQPGPVGSLRWPFSIVGGAVTRS